MVSEWLARLRDAFPVLQGLNDWQTAGALFVPFLALAAVSYLVDVFTRKRPGN
jgi:hypothetical protein